MRIDISRGATIGIYLVNSVGEQTAVSGIEREPIDHWYVVSGRRQYDRRAMRDHECTRQDDKAGSRLGPKGGYGRFDLCVAVNGRGDWLNLE